jgi:carbonic anhydrase/acetyltransferase-like protein (isoleucine patch superfamily)
VSPLILPFDGKTPRIADDVFVAETATVIGDVEIGARSSLWYGAILRGDLNWIRVGRNTNIQDGTIVHVNHERAGFPGGEPTTIGDNVLIGHLALIHACTIEDEAFIGMRAVVMDRAVVERGAMIAAGSVVTPGKVIEAGQLWAGTPARYVRDVSPEMRAENAYLVDHYCELAATYLRDRAKDA